MQKIVKYPYGISNFESLVKEGYLFLDSTEYIEKLENLNERYLVFLRPRRFGKSLFISILDYYYNINHKDKFKDLFSKYSIGKNPTKKKNSYMILNFDFSGIDTRTNESTYDGFYKKIKLAIEEFISNYKDIFSENDIKNILSDKTPEGMLGSILQKTEQNTKKKIYVLVDEYDHFANEILSMRYNDYLDVVAKNGFVRKFYEVIKTGTHSGVVDRIFMTGVSPITLDSLTSGFNISTNLTLSKKFHDMLGFTKDDVKYMIEKMKKIRCENIDEKDMMKTIKKNYNGYKFHKDSYSRVYNPNMTLYFLNKYQDECSNPEQMVDENIMSDYGKIKRLFKLEDENRNIKILEEFVENKQLTSKLTTQFSLEKEINRNDFISILFYQGILTIKEEDLGELVLQSPNYVTDKLYLKFFASVIKENSEIKIDPSNIEKSIKELAKNNNLKPFLELITKTLKSLSNRDFIKFDEKYVKLIMYTYFSLSDIYYVRSEQEINKKYLDISLFYGSYYKPPYQFIFEIKYLKKGSHPQTLPGREGRESNKLEDFMKIDGFEKKLKEAKIQLKEYLNLEKITKHGDNVVGYAIVFVETEVYFEVVEK